MRVENDLASLNVDGWTSRRLRFDSISNPKKSRVALAPEAEVSFIPMEAVGEFGGLNLEQVRPLDEVYGGYTYLADGDICIAKITPCFENGKGALAAGLKNGAGFGTTELHIVRTAEELSPRFFFYVSMSHAFRSLGTAEMIGAGGQKRIPEDFIKDWQLTRPSLPKQEQIADYLDERTARIDGLIARKERLLELLAEKRQALITRAVTKGIDPGAPMKPSGIGWLGDIPAHWEVNRLKYTVGSPLKYGANAAAEFDVQEWPRFVRITDIDSLGDLREETFRSLPPEVAEGYLLEPNDILLARSGATVGKSFVHRSDWGAACFAGYLIRYRVRPDYCPGFFAWFLNSSAYWGWIGAHLIQATIQNVSAERYGVLAMPVPPRDEQERIAEDVTHRVGQIDKVVTKVGCSIEHLREHRSGLITAAVTGQLDVTGEAA